jgi:hypothetical protein
VNCPICVSSTRPHAVPRYRHCPTCTHAFLAEPPTPDHLERVCGDDYFTARGAGYDDYLTDSDLTAHVYDIDAAFTATSRALATGGVWLIETWNGASLTARVFGKHWHEGSPPSVRRVFTERSLDHLAARFGLTRIAGGRPTKALRAAHAKSLFREKAQSSPVARAVATLARIIPDRVVIPYPSKT